MGFTSMSSWASYHLESSSRVRPPTGSTPSSATFLDFEDRTFFSFSVLRPPRASSATNFLSGAAGASRHASPAHSHLELAPSNTATSSTSSKSLPWSQTL